MMVCSSGVLAKSALLGNPPQPGISERQVTIAVRTKSALTATVRFGRSSVGGVQSGACSWLPERVTMPTWKPR